MFPLEKIRKFLLNLCYFVGKKNFCFILGKVDKLFECVWPFYEIGD